MLVRQFLYMFTRVGSVMLALAVIALPATAQPPSTLDFEDQAQLVEEPLESLILSGNGIKVEITRPGTFFSIAFRPGFPPEWDTLALSPFIVTRSEPMPFVIDFTKPVRFVSIDAGDFGQDEDFIVLSAFDGPGGTGDRVAITRAMLPGSNTFEFSHETLMVEAPGIRSIVVVGGSTHAPNSVFYDNLSIELDGKKGKGGGNGNGNGNGKGGKKYNGFTGG